MLPLGAAQVRLASQDRRSTCKVGRVRSIVLALLLAPGCASHEAAPKPAPPEPPAQAQRPAAQPEPEPKPEPAPCVVSVCLSGAGSRTTGGNPAFARVCEPLQGLVRRCDPDGTCYPTFQITQKRAAFSALFDALDHDANGRIDANDAACDVNVVGYSWGGINGAELVQDFVTDARIDPSRRTVGHFIAVDAYRPMAKLDVPEGVGVFTSIRHSASPPGDCSERSPLGPYHGIEPRCRAGQCTDIDVSAKPDASFESLHRGRLRGHEIGHCSIVGVAGAMIWSLLPLR